MSKYIRTEKGYKTLTDIGIITAEQVDEKIAPVQTIAENAQIKIYEGYSANNPTLYVCKSEDEYNDITTVGNIILFKPYTPSSTSSAGITIRSHDGTHQKSIPIVTKQDFTAIPTFIYGLSLLAFDGNNFILCGEPSFRPQVLFRSIQSIIGVDSNTGVSIGYIPDISVNFTNGFILYTSYTEAIKLGCINFGGTRYDIFDGAGNKTAVEMEANCTYQFVFNDSSFRSVETTRIYAHTTDTNNPHEVTKAQVGLSNVDNVKQYSETNPPPYPVTSVNGQTGAVSFTTEEWTFTLSDGSTVTKRVMLG